MESSAEVFIAYAHEDEQFLDELEKHLGILKLQGLIAGWYDREITVGREWITKVDRHLNAARIVLLFISPDFLDSDYYSSIEMNRAMERHASGEALVIPIIVRPVYWQRTPFGKLPALPKDGKPITKWLNYELAFLDIAIGIRKAIESLLAEPNALNNSSRAKQSTGGLEAPASNKLEELEVTLRKSYSSIRGYEDIVRISDDPAEKVQARKSIEKQSILARHFLSEYLALANQLGVRVPIDITQISGHVGNL